MRYLLFVLTLSCVGQLTAQNPYLDSLKAVVAGSGYNRIDQVKAYTNLAWEYRRINLDTGFIFLAKAKALLGESAYDSLHYERGYVLGTLQRYNGDYEKSATNLLQCLAFSEAQQDSMSIGRCHYALSIAYNENKDFEQALMHAQSSRDISRALGALDREVGALNVLATILKDVNRAADAEAAYLDAVQLVEQLDNPYQAEAIYNNLATAYMDQQKYEDALVYYGKSLQINQNLEDDLGVANVQGNIANLYFYMGFYEQALDYFERSYAGKQKVGTKEDLLGVQGQIAATKIYLGQKQEGLRELEESLRLTREGGYKNEAISLLKALIESTYDNGLYEVAARYQKEYITEQAKSYEEIIDSKVDELSAQYEKKEQDQAIALLSSENELQAERISRQRWQLWGGGAILLLVSLLLFSIYNLYRKLGEQNKVIAKALGEKEILLKEIHHRVKNNLQVVSSLLNLQSYKIKDEAALKAIQEGRTRVHSMSLIHQTLYRKDNLMGVNISDYLAKLCQSLFDTYKVSAEKVQLETDISPLMLDVDSVVPLGLIINELITNSLKYAFPNDRKGKISIKIEEQPEGLLLAVNDDGVGMENVSDVQHGDSFGYELINAFAQKLEADLKVNGQVGTKVSLLIRNYQKAA